MRFVGKKEADDFLSIISCFHSFHLIQLCKLNSVHKPTGNAEAPKCRPTNASPWAERKFIQRSLAENALAVENCAYPLHPKGWIYFCTQFTQNFVCFAWFQMESPAYNSCTVDFGDASMVDCNMPTVLLARTYVRPRQLSRALCSHEKREGESHEIAFNSECSRYLLVCSRQSWAEEKFSPK